MLAYTTRMTSAMNALWQAGQRGAGWNTRPYYFDRYYRHCTANNGGAPRCGGIIPPGGGGRTDTGCNARHPAAQLRTGTELGASAG